MRVDFLRMVIVLRIFLLLILLNCSSCASPPKIITHLDSNHRQVIYIQAQGSYGKLSMWEKDKHWRNLLNARVVIGQNGLAAVGDKHEGDGKTPQGTYALKRSFGYAPQTHLSFPYTQVTPKDKWVDDSASIDYNQWVTETTAHSFEILRREDHLYTTAVVIEYNTDPIVPDAGSAIFMHVWRRYDAPTAGCVAMSSRNMRKILATLDPTKQPVIILGVNNGK